MNQLSHLCGHPYHQDCMRHPPRVEQITASVCLLCATHVLYTVVAQDKTDTETRFDILYLPPRARTMRRMALAAHDPGEASQEFQAVHPHAVYLAPDALDTALAGRQPKGKPAEDVH